MDNEDYVDLRFPAAGIDRMAAFWKQPNKDIGGKIYARTTYNAVNVRTYEAGHHRARGGTRSGLSRLIPEPIVAGWIVQSLALVVGNGYNPPGGSVQQSQSGRVVTVVTVTQGDVYVASAGDTAWATTINTTGDTPPLVFTGLVFSSPNGQILYFADGSNYVKYTPATNTVSRWTATAGTLPVDSQNNTPRLICTWRGRTVLSGLLKDPHNWFMSKIGDPTDFDYSPLSPSPADAEAGNNSRLGLVGDVITSLCPYNDDVLIMFGDHTIWMMRGDPRAGGQIDLVSDAIGGTWGKCWCKDPYGNVYFVSNKCGVYVLQPGHQPVRISQGIEELLQEIDTGNSSISLTWNDRAQGLHVFVTALDEPTPSRHFFYEHRAGAWWTDTFANDDHNPLCCCDFDGNDAGDRAVLIGSWDGYVRKLDPDALTDDGTKIQSEVVIGPILTPNMDDVDMKALQTVLGNGSGAVDFEVRVAETAEQALVAPPVARGEWTENRNFTTPIRFSAHALYVFMASTERWSMEQIRVTVATRGKSRRRGA